MLKFISRCKFFFRRGWSDYLSLPMGIINFTLISYNFAIKKLDGEISYLMFFCVFVMVFPMLATVIGWVDVRFGTYKEEIEQLGSSNPIYKRILKNQEDILRKLSINKYKISTV